MMFGNEPGGVAPMAAAERDCKRPSITPSSSWASSSGKPVKPTRTYHRLFRLSEKDVKMMVSITEWGKVSSVEVAASLMVGASDQLPAEKVIEDPSVLIGQYLTELIRITRRNLDINRVLLTGLEAIHRRIRPDCVLLAFPDAATPTSARPVPAWQWRQGRRLRRGSPGERIADCALSETAATPPVAGLAGLPGSFSTRANLHAILVAPLVVDGKSIGLCLVGREKATPFSEQEQSWIDAVMSQFSMAFERSRSRRD